MSIANLDSCKVVNISCKSVSTKEYFLALSDSEKLQSTSTVWQKSKSVYPFTMQKTLDYQFNDIDDDYVGSRILRNFGVGAMYRITCLYGCNITAPTAALSVTFVFGSVSITQVLGTIDTSHKGEFTFDVNIVSYNRINGGFTAEWSFKNSLVEASSVVNTYTNNTSTFSSNLTGISGDVPLDMTVSFASSTNPSLTFTRRSLNVKQLA